MKNSGTCYLTDLGELELRNVNNEGSLLGFNIVIKQIMNYSEYAIILKVKADYNDGQGYKDIAIVSKKFKVIYDKAYENKLINWYVEFENIVVEENIYNEKVEYKLELVSGNYIRLLQKDRKFDYRRCGDDLINGKSCCYKKHIGTFTINIPIVPFNEIAIKRLRAKG